MSLHHDMSLTHHNTRVAHNFASNTNILQHSSTISIIDHQSSVTFHTYDFIPCIITSISNHLQTHTFFETSSIINFKLKPSSTYLGCFIISEWNLHSYTADGSRLEPVGQSSGLNQLALQWACMGHRDCGEPEALYGMGMNRWTAMFVDGLAASLGRN